jgi:hypothetical protein
MESASAAGFLTGLMLLGIPAYALRETLDPLASGDFTVWVILSDLVWVNGWWSVLNLLPIMPLDGGLIARRVLLHVLGPRGERAALVLSIAVAAGGAALALAADSPFLVLYASFFVARDGWHLWRRDDTSRDRIREARQLLDGQRRSGGLEILRDVASEARTPDVRKDARAPRPGRCWTLGDMIVGHLARSGAVPAVVDHLLAAEGDEAAANVAVLQTELHFGGQYLPVPRQAAGDVVGDDGGRDPSILEQAAPDLDASGPVGLRGVRLPRELRQPDTDPPAHRLRRRARARSPAAAPCRRDTGLPR